ncbi:MAG: tetraacyldisaccharide 4'-kinase [Magnetococcales bacterium]|nr:tetraacyldisaccharide 4'-kinase [Magnetococcales bacterium]
MQRLLPWLDGSRAADTPAMKLLLALLGGVGAALGGLQWLKAKRHELGICRAYRAPCPVISVGNLTVGGTGKTPMVLWIARRLQAAGHRVAVVSRGYRQESRARVTVVADPDGVRLAPPEAADEAVLIARSLPGVTVLTGADRPALIRHAVEALQCDRIVMDDGFHRLDVARDLDLVLVDARRPFGNGRLLPGGILREFPAALSRCDALILTRADDPISTGKSLERLGRLFPGQPLLTAIHAPTAWIPIHPPGPPLPLDALRGQAAYAFCGLAAPEGFQRTLAALPLALTGFHPFPDHHPFTSAELERLQKEAQKGGADCLVCTEKDAVKVHASPAIPLFALRVEMQVEQGRGWLEREMPSG